MSALPSLTAMKRLPWASRARLKTEYDKFKDADARYQERESYKIAIEPTSSVYIHECPPESPAQGRIGAAWLTEGKRDIRYSLLDL
jgi:hypothetical protein